ncbi:MAG: serine hydrolase [Bacteroidetes bacterium]|nr:serine hydrolase [Bacteroidota bacterium]
MTSQKIKTILILTGLGFILNFSEVHGQDISDIQATFKAENRADSLLKTMTLREQIGQLFMVAAYSNRDSAHIREIETLIKEYHVGGLIFFQGSPIAQARLANFYQSVSDIPLWVAMDGEWGLGMRLDSAMSFPYQMTLGAVNDNRLIYKMGLAIGRQFRRIGMHINYAPVLDVNNNAENPVINFRSFGDNKKNVAEKGMAYVRGLQDAGVLATGKHFPGHGDTHVDSHKDLPLLEHSWERLDTMELYPFKETIRQGLSGIMVAHLNIPSLDRSEHVPSTLSKKIVKGILRDSLGFEGLVFTDALGMEGVAKYFKPGEIELMALQADNDVLLFPQNMPLAVQRISDAVKNDELKKSVIYQKCKKILVAKYLLNVQENMKINISSLLEDINNLDDRLLNRRLHLAAITVIKNTNNRLPLMRLDTLKIASLTIGSGKPGVFEKRLSQYTLVDHFTIEKNEIEARKENILDSLKNYDLVVLGVDNLSKWPGRNYGVTAALEQMIHDVTASMPSILIWWGSPYGLARINDFEQADAVVITYQEDELMKDFVAQLVFGGTGASGTLPVLVNASYPSGYGIKIDGGVRFSYGLPEEAGLNGRYLKIKIDSIARFALNNGVAPGLQVLIARHQKVVLHKTYGYHTYDSLHKVMDTDMYDLASVTKITGALPALMRLHDQGKFSLEATPGDYLESFRKGNKKDLTFRRILSHNARLKAWIPYWQTTLKKNGKFKRKTLSYDSSAQYTVKLTDNLYLHKDYKQKIYKMIRKSKLLPEEGYVYSGLSFYLYPEIVENLTGKDFETHLKNTFYKPLGAYTITYNPWKHFSPDRIIPTEVDTFFRKELLHGVVHDEGAAMMNGVSSNAGLFTTAGDLAKLMQMYLNMGTYGDKRYISRNTLEKFTFCHYCEEGNRRGLAFDKPVLENKAEGIMAIDASHRSFGHSGYTGTFTWADPETGILFIFLSNRVHPTRENRKLYQLNIRPAMHQAIYDARFY